MVFAHEPDMPTTWPWSLIPRAIPTVSPGSGDSSRIWPCAARTRRTPEEEPPLRGSGPFGTEVAWPPIPRRASSLD